MTATASIVFQQPFVLRYSRALSQVHDDQKANILGIMSEFGDQQLVESTRNSAPSTTVLGNCNANRSANDAGTLKKCEKPGLGNGVRGKMRNRESLATSLAWFRSLCCIRWSSNSVENIGRRPRASASSRSCPRICEVISAPTRAVWQWRCIIRGKSTEPASNLRLRTGM